MQVVVLIQILICNMVTIASATILQEAPRMIVAMGDVSTC